ncbi:MAG: 30S ribosome-binding factor RbfA [Ruminococcaceae bacterium]|nr:30S ribosome-binding factor RbfA [Oscillospiraceae bacterium]
MAKYRRNRINDSVAEEAAQIIREVKDPRVSGSMITITGADVTADLKYAKLFYSVLAADEEERKEIAKGLKSAATFMRSQLARRLNLRITPEITFVEDKGVEHGAKIAELLKSISSEKPNAEPGEEADDE